MFYPKDNIILNLFYIFPTQFLLDIISHFLIHILHTLYGRPITSFMSPFLQIEKRSPLTPTGVAAYLSPAHSLGVPWAQFEKQYS